MGSIFFVFVFVVDVGRMWHRFRRCPAASTRDHDPTSLRQLRRDDSSRDAGALTAERVERNTNHETKYRIRKKNIRRLTLDSFHNLDLLFDKTNTQIHAPLLPFFPDRALLFFACVTGGERCSRKQDAWVGVRVQGPRREAVCSSSTTAEKEEEVKQAAPAAPAPPSAPIAAADSWGLDEEGDAAGGWGVGKDEGEEKTNSSNVDFSQLATELSSAAEALQISSSSSKASKPRKKPRDKEELAEKEKGEGSQPPPLLWTQPGEAGPTLPSFFVSWSPEEVGASSSSSSGSASASTRAKGAAKITEDPESSIDDAHVAALLAKYEASERVSGGGGRAAAKASSSLSSSSAAATASTSTLPAEEAAEALASSRLADSLGWSGEAYEPDSTPGASAAFLAFAKKVGKSPEQVARYFSRGGSQESFPSVSSSSPPRLLWPEAEGPPSPPPPCPHCGSARQYEAQLMAPLVALLDEAGEWEEEEEEKEKDGKEGEGGKKELRRRRRGKPALRRAPESWEWLTVAMATCLADCCSGGNVDDGGSVFVSVEEAVAVAFE